MFVLEVHEAGKARSGGVWNPPVIGQLIRVVGTDIHIEHVGGSETTVMPARDVALIMLSDALP